MTNSTLSLEQTADASLPGAVNPGQNSVLAEWETSMVYIMFQEEWLAEASISLSESPSVLTSLFLIKGPTNLSQRMLYHIRQCLTSAKLEEMLNALRQHCHANCNLLKCKRKKKGKCITREIK